jgi:predicted nucleic-acid-binding protein
MIGLDTNVLIRFIVYDDPIQRAKADKFIIENISMDNPGYINAVVLCEVVWVLKKAYHNNKQVILSILQQLLNTRELIIEQSDAARQAVDFFETGEADFSDYYMAAMNRLAGCKYTATFNRYAGAHYDFNLL